MAEIIFLRGEGRGDSGRGDYRHFKSSCKSVSLTGSRSNIITCQKCFPDNMWEHVLDSHLYCQPE